MYHRKFPKIKNLDQLQHTEKKPVILLGVLDWGLGHASRMIALIRYLSQFQCQILIAATGPQRKMLELEFPDLYFLSPPEYGVKYKKANKNLVFGLIRQLPRLLQVITIEREWIRRIHLLYKLDCIISDNRYGFRHPDVESIIITHQVAPISGLGSVFDQIIKKIHAQYLENFNACWTPDLEQGGLAGRLSHSGLNSKKLKFIGPLSRFEKTSNSEVQNGHLLVLLSGPEPRRTQFEELLIPQLEIYQGSYLLVRGLPTSSDNKPNQINYAEAKQLQQLIEKAEFIICRSGYTTIMDLVKIKKTALLVPTPGQTEQEYLAAYLENAGLFLHSREKGFNLQTEVERLRNFKPSFPDINFQQFETAVDELLNKLNSKV